MKLNASRVGSASRALAALALLVSACAQLPAPQGTALPSVWLPSPNFDQRRPNYIVIHATASNQAQHALRVLTDPQRKVSSHYLIARDGSLYQLVDERERAWHAGLSSWGGTTDINSTSLGIELDNNGSERFPEVQIAALIALLDDIATRYAIPAANYLGHGDVAPGRKVDPSAYFPWHKLAERGYGLWCDGPLPDAPATLDPVLGLRALGYDTSNEEAAVLAFKRRFIPDDGTVAWDARARSVLQCLLTRKAGAGG